MEKVFISAQALLEDSFHLGGKIIQSDFHPNFIVAIWRGGTPVGIAVQELLEYCGYKSDHIAIRTSAYTGINERGKTVRVHGLGYIIDNINASDSLLIVDDVFDSGLSIDAVINQLETKARLNTPEDIRIATPWFKPANNKTNRKPDYFLHETDKWLVFPHEISGLEDSEIKSKNPHLGELLEQLTPA